MKSFYIFFYNFLSLKWKWSFNIYISVKIHINLLPYILKSYNNCFKIIWAFYMKVKLIHLPSSFFLLSINPPNALESYLKLIPGLRACFNYI